MSMYTAHQNVASLQVHTFDINGKTGIYQTFQIKRLDDSSITAIWEQVGFRGPYLSFRESMRSLITAGSASVEVSPRFEKSFAAIFLRIRRIIFPERVLGSPGAH